VDDHLVNSLGRSSRRLAARRLAVCLAAASLLASLAACGAEVPGPSPTQPGGEATPPPEATPTGEPTPPGEATPPAEATPAEPTPPTAPTPPPEAGDRIQITFWSWVPGIEEQVNAFNESQSEIWVSYLNAGAGDAQYAALRTALETNVDVPYVVQIEYQHLPSFSVRGDLANLADYGANDVRDQFEEWTVEQASLGDGIYAYPQDAGPMIMMCNTALLEEHGVAVPTTWDEVLSASAALHSADPDVYLMNLTADQGHFFGLLWQSGAHPFDIEGDTIAIDFTSPEVTRVAELWQGLLDSGDLSPIATYTSDWNSALAARQIACWTAGAWGPSLIESAAPEQSGDWQIFLMPQWTAGEAVNGNYGGSTIAVTSASANPAAAETFARWLTTDPQIVIDVTQPPANLFPVVKSALADPAWTEFAPEFWGGQQTHQVMAEAATQVDVTFQWSPFTDFVYTTFDEELNGILAGQTTFQQAMQNLQERSVAFAQDQGFTVR
jgi:multiple sugar transport system substrate-binding protein